MAIFRHELFGSRCATSRYSMAKVGDGCSGPRTVSGIAENASGGCKRTLPGGLCVHRAGITTWDATATASSAASGSIARRHRKADPSPLALSPPGSGRSGSRLISPGAFAPTRCRRSVRLPTATARRAAIAATRSAAAGHATARARRNRSSDRTGRRCLDSCRIGAAAARNARSASHPHGPAPWPADRSEGIGWARSEPVAEASYLGHDRNHHRPAPRLLPDRFLHRVVDGLIERVDVGVGIRKFSDAVHHGSPRITHELG